MNEAAEALEAAEGSIKKSHESLQILLLASSELLAQKMAKIRAAGEELAQQRERDLAAQAAERERLAAEEAKRKKEEEEAEAEAEAGRKAEEQRKQDELKRQQEEETQRQAAEAARLAAEEAKRKKEEEERRLAEEREKLEREAARLATTTLQLTVAMPPLRYDYSKQVGRNLVINHSTYKDTLTDVDYAAAREANAYFMLNNDSFSSIAQQAQARGNKNYLQNATIHSAALDHDFFKNDDFPKPYGVSFVNCYLNCDLRHFDTKELKEMLRGVTFQNCQFGHDFKVPEDFKFSAMQFRTVEKVGGKNVLKFDENPLLSEDVRDPLPAGTPKVVSAASMVLGGRLR